MLKEIKIRDLFGYNSYDIQMNEKISFVFGTDAIGKSYLAKVASGHQVNNLAKTLVLVFSDEERELNRNETLNSCYGYIGPENIINNVEGLKPMNTAQFNIFKEMVESFYPDYDPSCKKVVLQDDKVAFKAKTSLDSDWEQELSFENLSLGEKQVMLVLNELITTTREIVFLDSVDCFMHILWQEQLYDAFEQCIASNHQLKQIIVFTHSPFTVAGHEDNIVEPELI